jgi:hypothetical protein
MDPMAIQGWITVIEALVPLGVKSWQVIHGLLADAGVAHDQAVLTQLKPKWDALVSDIARASQSPS